MGVFSVYQGVELTLLTTMELDELKERNRLRVLLYDADLRVSFLFLFSPPHHQGVETNSPDNKGTVDGLAEGKEYEFRVMAKNKAGLSEPSTTSPSIITKARKGSVPWRKITSKLKGWKR